MRLIKFIQIVQIVSIPLTPGVWIRSPIIDPFRASQSTEFSVRFSWSVGEHSTSEIQAYEVEMRYPVTVIQDDSRIINSPNSENFFSPRSEYVSSWSPWTVVYSSTGRQFVFDATGLPSRAFAFRVRAVTASGSASGWSPPVMTHVRLPPEKERVMVELIGTGRNAPDYSEIRINGEIIFSRSDRPGLTLATFHRADLSRISLRTFNTQMDPAESAELGRFLRSLDQSVYIFVISSDAWERFLSPSTASILESVGGFYVGQWARTINNDDRSLGGTASQDSFGHPYALIGMPGLGMGRGWESLQLNTGHYLTRRKTERAIVRVRMEFHYGLGRYLIPDRSIVFTHQLFSRAQPPAIGTLHNPNKNRIRFDYYIQQLPQYIPHIGTVRNYFEYIVEGNQTIELKNFTNTGFEISVVIMKPEPVVFNDPRRGSRIQTELERIWGGPSQRTSVVAPHADLPGVDSFIPPEDRLCPNIIEEFFDPALPPCPQYGSQDAPDLLKFGVGVYPTVCYSECIQREVLDFRVL
jgi:hypothetical protein